MLVGFAFSSPDTGPLTRCTDNRADPFRHLATPPPHQHLVYLSEERGYLWRIGFPGENAQ